MDPPQARVERLGRLLSPDERQRAERFHFDRHRRRYIVGRGFLRTVLGEYLGVDPASIRFVYGEKDKPSLAEIPADGPLHFNLSHSENLALLGLNREREIGVDVELRREMKDMEAVASRFFSKDESRTLLALPPEQQAEGFFNCWTRKEAYLKAIGDGLSAPLNAFDVTLRPGEPARMLALEGDPERGAAWTLEDLQPAEGFAGAVAIEDGGWSFESWAWEPEDD